MSNKTRIVTCLEFAGMQYAIKDLEKFIKEKVTEKYPDLIIKEIGIYMQPETNYIYYTVNGEGTPEDCISFDDVALPI